MNLPNLFLFETNDRSIYLTKVDAVSLLLTWIYRSHIRLQLGVGGLNQGTWLSCTMPWFYRAAFRTEEHTTCPLCANLLPFFTSANYIESLQRWIRRNGVEQIQRACQGRVLCLKETVTFKIKSPNFAFLFQFRESGRLRTYLYYCIRRRESQFHVRFLNWTELHTSTCWWQSWR